MKKLAIILLALLLVIGTGYYFVSRQYEKQEREDMVWMARLVLEEIKADKSFEYLRLDSITYYDRNLMLTYRAKHDIFDIISLVTDSVSKSGGKTTLKGHAIFSIDSMSKDSRNNLLQVEFASLVSIAPHKWDSIFRTLVRAETDLSVNFSNYENRYSILIPYGKMMDFMADRNLLMKGKSYFIKRKKAEVLDYAKGHFRGDPYLHVDSLAVQGEFVSLYISYDDSKYRIGKSYLDSQHINPHFTDAVGNMGSILDGMLTLCSKTGYGLEFVYVGNKNHRVERCLISADNVNTLIEKQSNRLWANERKTNTVKTTIGEIQGKLITIPLSVISAGFVTCIIVRNSAINVRI